MIRTLFPMFLLAFGSLTACGDKTSTDTGTTTTTGDADTDVDSDTDADTDPMACTTDICAVYGPAVPTAAGQITDAAATDPEFSDAFAPLVAGGEPGIQNFKDSLANFISDAYGCSTGAYTGPTMEAAHAGMNIDQTTYDDFVGLIVGVLLSDGVPQADIDHCFAPVLTDPAFEATIIGQ